MENQCGRERESAYGLRDSESSVSREKGTERVRSKKKKNRLNERDGQRVVFSLIFTAVTSVVFLSFCWI